MKTIVIYGCGSLGELFAQSLPNFGIDIDFFIDKRGDELTTFYGKEVFSIDDSLLDLNNKIVLIAVKNVFEHESIAMRINKLGAKIIFYKQKTVLDGIQLEEDQIYIDRIYEDFIKITRKDFDCNNAKLLFNTYSKPFPEYRYSAVVLKDTTSVCNEDYVVSYISSFLIFSDKVDNQNIDNPISFLKMYYELYDYFFDHEKYPAEYIDFCIKAVKNVDITERWKQNIFNNRLMIFEKMNNALNLDFNFFIRSAPNVKLNNSYFNLNSGKHRATFLYYKNHSFIPVKMSKEDYNTYINISAVNIVKNYCLKNNISNFSEPIEHPFFYESNVGSNIEYFSITKSIIDYLLANEDIKKIRKMNFFMGYNTNGFIPRIFSRYGMHVDVFEPTINDIDLFTLLNSMFSINGCNIKKNIDNLNEYDIVVIQEKLYTDSIKNTKIKYCFIICDDIDKLSSFKYEILTSFLSEGKKTYFCVINN